MINNLIPNIDYIYIDNNMDWFNKIMNIIKNNDKYNTIRQNGYNKAIEYYQWSKWAETLNKVIQS